MEERQAIDKARSLLQEEKSGAVWLSFIDINDLISYSALSRQYFNKSGNWLLQRLHGYNVNGKPATFKPQEYTQLVKALRDIAQKLSAAATTIEQAAPDKA